MEWYFIKKLNFFKKNYIYIKLSCYIIAIILISSFLDKFLTNFEPFTLLADFIIILRPFIYGAIMAYIFNPFMSYVENKLLDRIKFLKNYKNIKRNLAIAVTFILVLGFIFCISSYVIPEVITNSKNLLLLIQNADINYMENTLNKYIFTAPSLHYISHGISIKLFDFLTNGLPKLINSSEVYTGLFSSILDKTMGIASGIFNLIMGIVISFYMLADKELFGKLAINTLNAFLNKEKTQKIVEAAKASNIMFERFFLGKIIDSFIIGIIFFIGGLLLDLPYLLLLSIIIGVTNIIPFFGPFIGGVPVVLFTLFASPSKAIWVTIFIFFIQQFDGNILGPKILGDSIGIRPLGVIFSITVGGALFGVMGMFFGVPIFALISTAYKTFLKIRLSNKNNI